MNQHATTINLKFLAQLGMMNFIFLMDLIPLQTFKASLNLSSKNTETLVGNPPVQIYPNKTKNRIVFKVKTGCKLELLSPKILKLLGSVNKDVNQDKDGEDVPKLESVEVILLHCNLVNNNNQQVSKVLFTFVPNKRFGQLINIAPHSLIMLNTTSTEFSSIEVWFTDQNSEHLKLKTMLI